LWHELWHEGLEEASRLYFSEGNVKGMFSALEPLHQMMERGPQTLKETSFNQVRRNKCDITKICSLLESYCVSCFRSLAAHSLVCACVLSVHVSRLFIQFCCVLTGIWSRSDGSPGMVQKVSTIRKCKRSDTGMGFVLLGFQTNLQATSSGEAKTL